MFKDLFLKWAIKKYIKKLNNKMLKDVYFSELKKVTRTHIDNVYMCMCMAEMKKRGIVRE